MCKQSNLSKYQKQIVNELTTLIGVTIPFTYEKAQNNHLKVLIDGIEKPMYTGSTPSDRNSAKNFIAQVKRALKQLEPAANDESVATNRAQPHKGLQHKETEKVIECCIKSLRTRKQSLQQKETEYMLEQGDLDLLHPYRSEVVKLTVEHAMKQRKHSGYFRPKQRKELELNVKKHLDFAMPTKADYADLLANQCDVLPEPDEQVFEPSNVVALDCATEASQSHSSLNEVPIQDQVIVTETPEQGNTAQQLMSLPKGKRVNLLRDLSSDHLSQLIADIEQAKELNIRRAISEIKQLMKANDISAERLTDALEVA